MKSQSACEVVYDATDPPDKHAATASRIRDIFVAATAPARCGRVSRAERLLPRDAGRESPPLRVRLIADPSRPLARQSSALDNMAVWRTGMAAGRGGAEADPAAGQVYRIRGLSTA